RRIYVLGSGDNRYQLLGVEDLVDAIVRASQADVAGQVFNVGAQEFGTVRSDLEALIAHAGTRSRLRPIPARPAEIVLRGLELAKVSPLVEWHYKTASRDSYVDVSKAQRLLGWDATKSNVETLVENYDWYVANRGTLERAGVTHRVPWNQQALRFMPAYLPSAEVLETKLVTLFEGNAGTDLPTHQAAIAVFDPERGNMVALMDGTYITATRTAAGAALSVRQLAREDAKVLAIC